MLLELPDVPLIQIFKYLSFEDQKNIRIVCKSLAARAILLVRSLKVWNIRSKLCHLLPEYHQIIANVNLLVPKCCRMNGCKIGSLFLKDCQNVTLQWIRRHADNITSLEFYGGNLSRQIVDENIRLLRLREVKVENCLKNSKLASILSQAFGSLETMLLHSCEFCNNVEMGWLSELTCTFPQLDKLGIVNCSIGQNLNKALMSSFTKMTTLVLYKVDIKLFCLIEHDLPTVKYVLLMDCKGEKEGLCNFIERCSRNLTSLVLNQVNFKVLDTFDVYLPALKFLSISRCTAAFGQFVILHRCAANLQLLDIDESFDMNMCSRISLPELRGLYYKKLTHDHVVSGLNLMLGACHQSLLVLGIYLCGPGRYSSLFSSITQEMENLALLSIYPKPRTSRLDYLKTKVHQDTIFEHKYESLHEWKNLKFDFDLLYTKQIRYVMNYGDLS